ncbi:hypothetical protein [Chryseobacterium indoltheticum]|nr:hypothetical protein [Chryseobacterium indoltheticum]
MTTLNMLTSNTISKDREYSRYERSASKYTRRLEIADLEKKIIYRRDIKNFGLSNLFLDMERVEGAETIYIVYVDRVMKSPRELDFIYVGDHPIGTVELFMNTVSYMICNQTLLLAFPLILAIIYVKRNIVAILFMQTPYKNA